MQFDHIDHNKKTANISRLVFNNESMEIIKKELENCRVICCGCHRLKSFEEKNEAQNNVERKKCEQCKMVKNIANFSITDGYSHTIKDICKACENKPVKFRKTNKKHIIYDEENQKKECTICLNIKPYSDFNKGSDKLGLRYRCKDCEREYKKQQKNASKNK